MLTPAAKQYVPPALRNNKPSNNKPSNNKPSNNKPISLSNKPSITIAKKTALKKGFDLDQAAFPTLGDTLNKSTTAGGTPFSFSAAAAKKQETPVVKKIEVLPGWVHIRRQAGEIQYKYGELILTQAAADRIEKAEEVLNRIIVKNRIAREEYDRNRDIERLGDLSEYSGQPTLAEMFDNEIQESASDDESSDTEIEYLD